MEILRKSIADHAWRDTPAFEGASLGLCLPLSKTFPIPFDLEMAIHSCLVQKDKSPLPIPMYVSVAVKTSRTNSLLLTLSLFMFASQ